MAKLETLTFGISKALPKLLSYPGFIDLQDAPEIAGILCYVIKHYGEDGLSVLIKRRPIDTKDVETASIFGDWHGNLIDPRDTATTSAKLIHKFIGSHWGDFLEIMRLVKVDQAQFFLALIKGEFMLVDIQRSLDTLIGPGMIRDLFGTIILVQETLKIEAIDETVLDAIKAGSGSYAGDLIIKPTKFRTVQRLDCHRPLYVQVKR